MKQLLAMILFCKRFVSKSSNFIVPDSRPTLLPDAILANLQHTLQA